MKIKIATWNVQKPVAPQRREDLRSHTDRQHSDVWVLTETHDGFTPGHEFFHSSSAGRDFYRDVPSHKPEHRWVTIWSNHRFECLETSDKIRTAAVRITPTAGDPFVVFGTVLPWTGSQWRGHPSAGGVAFREALAVQFADWVRLRRDYPADEFFVLGDFNQDLVGRPPRYCGTRTNRIALESALEGAGLVALTGGDGDPIRRDSERWACIDHICARRDSKWIVESTVRWPDDPVPRRGLSDHFGVAAVLFRD